VRTIFKYPLLHGIDNVLHMDKCGVVRRVGVQENVCIWVEVCTNADQSARRFRVVGTGQEIPMGGVYAGSCNQDRFVWHVFEIPCLVDFLHEGELSHGQTARASGR
jgi:hypothetical protein